MDVVNFPAGAHYEGSPSLSGRASGEASSKGEFEGLLLSVMDGGAQESKGREESDPQTDLGGNVLSQMMLASTLRQPGTDAPLASDAVSSPGWQQSRLQTDLLPRTRGALGASLEKGNADLMGAVNGEGAAALSLKGFEPVADDDPLAAATLDQALTGSPSIRASGGSRSMETGPIQHWTTWSAAPSIHPSQPFGSLKIAEGDASSNDPGVIGARPLGSTIVGSAVEGQPKTPTDMDDRVVEIRVSETGSWIVGDDRLGFPHEANPGLGTVGRSSPPARMRQPTRVPRSDSLGETTEVSPLPSLAVESAPNAPVPGNSPADVKGAWITAASDGVHAAAVEGDESGGARAGEQAAASLGAALERVQEHVVERDESGVGRAGEQAAASLGAALERVQEHIVEPDGPVVGRPGEQAVELLGAALERVQERVDDGDGRRAGRAGEQAAESLGAALERVQQHVVERDGRGVGRAGEQAVESLGEALQRVQEHAAEHEQRIGRAQQSEDGREDLVPGRLSAQPSSPTPDADRAPRALSVGTAEFGEGGHQSTQQHSEHRQSQTDTFDTSVEIALVADLRRSQGELRGSFSSTAGQDSVGRPLLSPDDADQSSDVAQEMALPFGLAGVDGGSFSPAERRALPAEAAPHDSVAAQLARGTRAAHESPGHVVRIDLEPEGLGSVSLRLTMGAGGLQVNISSDLSATRDLVRASLPDLTDSLRQQGITLDQVQVGVGSGLLGEGGFNRAPQQGEAAFGRTRRFAELQPEPIESASSPGGVVSAQRVDYRV